MFGVLEDVFSRDPLIRADVAVLDFLQALHTSWGDRAMVAIAELGDPAVVGMVVLAALLWLAWRRAWRTAAYWTAAVIGAVAFAALLNVTLREIGPNAIHASLAMGPLTGGNATMDATVYGLLAILLSRETAPRRWPMIAVGAALVVASIGFARLYLGVFMLSDALAGLAFGVAWAALLGIAYLRGNPPPIGAHWLTACLVATLLMVGGIHIDHRHAADLARLGPREPLRSMALMQWWQQGWRMLPARRIDLAGEDEEPLTIQWGGSLSNLIHRLQADGWHRPVPWTRHSVLAWITPQTRIEQLPVLPRLENGRPETLIMVRPVTGAESTARLVLRLWRSDVEITGSSMGPIVIQVGTIAEERAQNIWSIMTATEDTGDFNTPVQALWPSIFPARRMRHSASAWISNWNGAVILGPGPNTDP